MTRRIERIFAEGLLDQAAAERIALDLGCGTVLSNNAGGSENFWRQVPKYNDASKRIGVVFLLADHDSTRCVGPRLATLRPAQHPNLVLRLAVAELEAWLLADRVSLASFLRVRESLVPRDPETLPDPKRQLVDLARRSTKPAIRDAIVPKPGRSSAVGAEYSLVMERFVREHWRPAQAAERSPSLRRALRALRRAISAAS